MGADGSEQGPPCGSSSLCLSCSRVQGEARLHDWHPGLTGANVPWRFLHQSWVLGLSPRDVCLLRGTAGPCQHPPGGPAAGSPQAEVGAGSTPHVHARAQRCPAQAEPGRGRSLPHLPAVSSPRCSASLLLARVRMEPAAPGAGARLCQALSHLPGRASHTCWEGDRSWATSPPLRLSGWRHHTAAPRGLVCLHKEKIDKGMLLPHRPPKPGRGWAPREKGSYQCESRAAP